MRQRLSLVLTLAAWLLATGSHWDLVQTFAWGRMLATYAQTMPLGEAVKKTFAPQSMCRLCHVVADARQQESPSHDAAGVKSPGKILLVAAPAALVVASPIPPVTGLVPAPVLRRSAGRTAPPTPPPRALA